MNNRARKWMEGAALLDMTYDLGDATYNATDRDTYFAVRTATKRGIGNSVLRGLNEVFEKVTRDG